MQDYCAFGGCLRSELEFPDLSRRSRSKTPDWEIQVSACQPSEEGEVQGEREVEPGWILRLYRLREGWRLEYGATGSYEVLDGGSRIVWHPGSDRREEVVRAVILGPLMALALHDSGILCLHGSAVAIGQRGIGFLAPKGYGKSTLAMALTAAGGRLMSDDLVAVTHSRAPEILPGVHSVRMRTDVVERMVNEFPEALLRDGWKKTLTNLPQHRLGWERVPLDALYVIRPIPDLPGDEPAERTPVRPLEGVLALARNSKLTDDLVGYSEAGRALHWITEVVLRVTVYELKVPRDLEKLSPVAAHILSWHDHAKTSGAASD